MVHLKNHFLFFFFLPTWLLESLWRVSVQRSKECELNRPEALRIAGIRFTEVPIQWKLFFFFSLNFIFRKYQETNTFNQNFQICLLSIGTHKHTPHRHTDAHTHTHDIDTDTDIHIHTLHRHTHTFVCMCTI